MANLVERDEKVQGLVVNYCKLLPKFVGTWSSELQESEKCVEGLCNQAEQLRIIRSCRGRKDLDDFNFEYMKDTLMDLMWEGIEEQMSSVQRCLDVLNKTNHDFRNRLSHLENSSLELPKECSVMQGSVIQPRLDNLLQLSLDFRIYFSASLNRMYDSYKKMDIMDEKSMIELEKSFKSVNLKDGRITYLLALTSMVNNEKINV